MRHLLLLLCICSLFSCHRDKGSPSPETILNNRLYSDYKTLRLQHGEDILDPSIARWDSITIASGKEGYDYFTRKIEDYKSIDSLVGIYGVFITPKLNTENLPVESYSISGCLSVYEEVFERIDISFQAGIYKTYYVRDSAGVVLLEKYGFLTQQQAADFWQVLMKANEDNYFWELVSSPESNISAGYDHRGGLGICGYRKDKFEKHHCVYRKSDHRLFAQYYDIVPRPERFQSTGEKYFRR